VTKLAVPSLRVHVDLSHDPATEAAVTAVTGQLRSWWPQAQVTLTGDRRSSSTTVLADFDGPVAAMDVLGAVIAAFGSAGVPTVFTAVTISSTAAATPAA
jgi:hypothetical protein